jgi:hypothetical protein
MRIPDRDFFPPRGGGDGGESIPMSIGRDGDGDFSTHRDVDGEATPDREFPISIFS